MGKGLHTVEEVGKCLIILLLSIKNATVNVKRKGLFNTRRCYHSAVCFVITHFDQSCNVGIVNCHEFVIGLKCESAGVSVCQSGKVVEVFVAIVARFPGVVERIPSDVAINEGGNVHHLAHPFVCHIDIGMGIINEGNHLPHNIIPCFHVFPDVEGLSCHLSCVVFHESNIHEIGRVSTDCVRFADWHTRSLPRYML